MDGDAAHRLFGSAGADDDLIVRAQGVAADGAGMTREAALGFGKQRVACLETVQGEAGGRWPGGIEASEEGGELCRACRVGDCLAAARKQRAMVAHLPVRSDTHLIAVPEAMGADRAMAVEPEGIAGGDGQPAGHGRAIGGIAGGGEALFELGTEKVCFWRHGSATRIAGAGIMDRYASKVTV